ncbi:MAG: hypothetical protein AVDCRST_MAG19-1109, partial [uncultured Thermomicrobiales bacterium]
APARGAGRREAGRGGHQVRHRERGAAGAVQRHPAAPNRAGYRELARV